MKLNGLFGRHIKKIFKKDFHSKENHKFSSTHTFWSLQICSSEIASSAHQPALFFTQSGILSEVDALRVVDGTVIIKNTESKTVQVIAYVSARSIELYKKWLSTKGSPRSIIQNANFEEREVTKEDEIPKSFSIKKVLLANGKQWADR